MKILYLILTMLSIAGYPIRGQALFDAENEERWTLPEGCEFLNSGNSNSRVLVVRNGDSASTWGEFHMKTPELSGKAIRVSYTVWCDGMSQNQERHAGAKVLIFQSEESIPFATTARVKKKDERVTGVFYPGAGRNLTIRAGIRDISGLAVFKNLKLEILDAAEFYPLPDQCPERVEYSSTMQWRPVYRGFMSPSRFTASTISEDMPEMRRWGANVVRWQLIRNWNRRDSDQSVEDYLSWIDSRIPEVKQVLDKAAELGMKVILDLHVPPGGRRIGGGEMNLFHCPGFVDGYLEAWKRLARAVAGHPALYGYDLLNEPYQSEIPAKVMDYLSLQYKAAVTVRSIDPKTPVVIESNLNASPAAFRYLKPLPLRDVVYQVHMYMPAAYTHQGVGNELPLAAYPGIFRESYYGEKRYYNKAELRRVLQPVRDFQRKYGAKILVGEFSVIRWAPGGERYLEDCIEIFEEYGWDWTYHAFREWSGWSVEHDGPKGDDSAARNDTLRKRVLLKYLRRNSRSEKVDEE